MSAAAAKPLRANTAASPAPSGSTKALIAALATYVLWGVLPVYWRNIRGMPPLEILCHRIVYSAVVVVLVWRPARIKRATSALLAHPATTWRACVASAMLALNWLIYIWGVNSGQVMEASLGYYISPLMSLVFGAVFLRERLRPLQWLSAAVACCGVAYLVVQHNRTPWFGLGLATTFALYGLLKKLAGLKGSEGFIVETLLLAPGAACYLLWRLSHHELAFSSAPQLSQGLLLCSGLISSAPLLLFGIATESLKLSTLGILQYLAPTVALSIAVLVYHEPLSQTHVVTFGLIWAGIVLYAVDLLRRPAKKPREAP